MGTNIYIRFDNPDIPGGADHAKGLEALSWNHGFAQPESPPRSAGGGGAAEQAGHQRLMFSKYLDGATHDLLRYCWMGKQIEKATLTCFRSDGSGSKPVKYLEIVMEHVVISDYSVSGGPGDIPVENVSLAYGTVQYTYTSQRGEAAGGDPVRHDLQAGKVT